MDVQGSESPNIQTFMIVWDVDLKIKNTLYRIDIHSPAFSIDPNKGEHTDSVRVLINGDLIRIQAYIYSIYSRCNTYVINPSTCTLLNIYNDFEENTWTEIKWSEKIRFVFEVDIDCEAPAAQSIIWKRVITETRPAINANGILLSLDAEQATHTVVNNRGVKCIVEGCIIENKYNLLIVPETRSGNWNLLTLMLEKQQNNDWTSYYVHTTGMPFLRANGRAEEKFRPRIVLEIHELIQSLTDISDSEIATIINVIKPTYEGGQQLNPAAGSRELQHQQNPLPNRKELCDITIHVQDERIKAHKLALSTSSTKWRDLFNEDEQLDTILINDFDYKTIRELIEFIYTGQINQATDQLLIAAHTFGVAGLTMELCEAKLIETIEIENVVNLLMLADAYKASTLYDRVMEFIGGNFKEFMALDEAKEMFSMLPEMAFKLYAKLSIK